jgi:hypothetical protein
MKYIKLFENFINSDIVNEGNVNEGNVNEGNETFTIVVDRVNNRGSRFTNEYVGTLEELTKQFSYTLEKGKAYENEKGNSKISMFPKNIKSLVANLNKAATNSSANGSSDTTYTYF